MGLLMTATLLSSFKWMQDSPASWAVRAQKDFLLKVRREDKFVTTPEIERGKEFERIICDNCNKYDEHSFLEVIKEIYKIKILADPSVNTQPTKNLERLLAYILDVCSTFYVLCKGGEQQVKVTKDIVVDGETFTLFGYIDVLQPTTILDLKTCTNFKESKYRDSVQHTIYQYCTNILDFKYVVANYEGGTYPTNCRVVETNADSIEAVERKIKGRIHNLVTYLKNNDLWDDYLNLFCRGEK